MPNKKKVSAQEVEIHNVDLAKVANGPVQNRSCTDIICFIIFAAFIGGMIAITGYALHTGNPELVGRGYDSDGNICGYDQGYEDYPLLYWPIPLDGDITRTVCVASCPKNPLPSALDCKTNTEFATCDGLNDQQAILDAINNNQIDDQTFFIYDTVDVAGRICLPAKSLIFASQVSDEFLNNDKIGQWISDVRTTWPIIIASIFIALAIGVVYMIFLRFCVGILTWAAILLSIAGPAVLGWRFYQSYKDTSNEIDSVQNNNEGLKKDQRTELIIAIICWVFTAVMLLTVCCLYNRIRLVIGILKASADFIKDTLSVLLVPIGFFVILFVFYVYWTITTVFLVSSGEPSQLSGLPVGTFHFDSTLQKLLIYHLFALLWCNAFINACCQFVIASAVCIWYFSQGTGQGSSGSVRKSIYRLFRYHLGSIAFGSLVLAIVQFIRFVLAYVQKKTKQWAGNQGKILRFVLGCMQCYVACFERFIKFLNKNAYIQIALTGKSFCFAAKDGFFLVMNNPLRFGVLYGIGSIFIFFGKCFIAAAATVIGFVIITNSSSYSDHIYSPFIPTLIMAIFTFTVASLFLSVYGMSADTILACFVVDEQSQKKRNGAPLHCPSALKDLIDRNRK